MPQRRALIPLLMMLLAACGSGAAKPEHDPPAASPPVRGALTVEERMPGTLFGTFASHQPAFAMAGGSLYKSYTVDNVAYPIADLVRNVRPGQVELRVARLESGSWRTLWSKTADTDPACLAEAGGKAYAVATDYVSSTLTVLEIDGATVTPFVGPVPFPSAAKQNCAMFNGELLIAGTYGNIVRFNVSTHAFSAAQQAIKVEYEPGRYTQYPQFSRLGDKLFFGYNTVPSGWRFLDLIGYVVGSVAEMREDRPLAKILPPEIALGNSFVSDTAGDAGHLYAAGTQNDYAVNTEYFADFANGQKRALAFFMICDADLSCTTQRTAEPQDLQGNFVRVGQDLYFLGGAATHINVWRLSGGKFELVKKVPHNLTCAYGWGFAPEAVGGVIYGHIVETPAWCDPGLGVADETYVGFRLSLD